MRGSKTWGIGLAGALYLAGCAMKAPTYMPVLDVNGDACLTTIDLSTAKSVVLAANKPTSVDVTPDAPCITNRESVNQVYEVFELPQSENEYLISVTSDPVGRGVFSPEVRLLDKGGKTLRVVSRDAFVFHGQSLYLGLRAHAGERYIVVLSDPRSLGKEFDQIVDSTAATTASTGTVFFTIYTGAEMTTMSVYAASGKLSVSAEPVPMAK